MAELFSFHAYRYNPEKVNRLEDVVTQPYDKITPEMWLDYIKRHSYNIVRVIKNRNYGEASRCLHDWIEHGILVPEQQPCFYPYEQIFELQGEQISRMGFIGLVSLDDAADNVKGHERVLDKPLEDRLQLIRSTEANEGLIFMLYSDRSLTIDQLLSDYKNSHAPVADLRDDYKVRHRLWALSDSDHQRNIREALRGKTLYIADGHHRFKTSVLYCEECRGKGWQPAATESFDKRMVALFNMEASGLRILPTHRGVRNVENFNLEAFLAKLEAHFVVESLLGLPELDRAMNEKGLGIGMAGPNGRFFLLRLKEAALKDPAFMNSVTGPARNLDVNVLHEGVLNPVLGIGAEALAGEKQVRYHRSRRELLQELREGRYQLAFFLKPTTLEQVRQISESGQQMPQKSTDFYPKLLTGLVLMRMQIDKNRRGDPVGRPSGTVFAQ